MNKISRYTQFVLFSLLVLLVINGCKKKPHSEMAKIIGNKYKNNKVYKQLVPDEFSPVFQQMLIEKKSLMTNPQLISAFYQQNDYEPVFVLQHLPKDELEVVENYYQHAAEHGLDPKMFQAAQIDSLLKKIADKNSIKTKEEAYKTLAELEIVTANSLINYSNALQFGVISPKKIYARYFTETKRPDSLSMNHVFEVKDLKAFLDSIQPKNPQYIALQKALAMGETAPGMTKIETERILKVNLERLRWKNKPKEDRYVLVNIANFGLNVIDHDSSILSMKVCVGEGRNKSYTNKLEEYSEDDKVRDVPFSRETPQLNSEIYSVQVNPVWNIPESIASNEIIKDAAADPYYLSNKNIDVYENGKKVENPETINWASVSKNNMPYSFKQQSGEGNALGKIKFLFPNKSSVYLHDTPAQAAFKQSMRAVSHGCVRLEKPLELAHVLFGDGKKYEQIENDMQETDPTATNISLPKKVPVYITYVTCWAENGKLVYRPDVYGLDIVLYTHIQKMLS
ncbi:L,D-transpeptidase scaffold domain-containing protein [Mucilaginibacter arboris]|uniref:L,D-transpeptidase family protein n=1 Tax=Mucilaginibacter arboris TaxID=2682090 RepID=A0A7K1SXK8_9SPHI|nr:L,D-transpeptidase family protein [Mucilaginibacter arboris]MVN22054.1 L,D-transpeptidase family protein [Mucilaginibacter arboris]